ncbi:MAG: T9SS type A sorting domain-containing protein [Saprospiraceae bacterium]
MKKNLLLIAALFCSISLFSQASFSTGAITVDVGEYGSIQLFTPDGLYQMDRASILVGTGTENVFDYWNDADVEELTALVGSPTQSDFEIYGSINNAYSGAAPDVIVAVNAYGWTDGAYALFKFNIKNNEATAMNAIAGLDILPYIDEEFGFDSVSYNAAEEVIRFHRGAQTNIGVKLLSAPLQSLYSFEWYDGYTVDTDYWTWMNHGSIDPLYASNTADGPVSITSQAAVMLASDESFDVWYAMSIGADEAAMLANMNEAVQKYQGLISSTRDLAVKGLELGQNQPNPFSGSTTISYNLPISGQVSLKVYDMLGNEIATLVEGNQAEGPHAVAFNASDLPSGVYFYSLRFMDTVKTGKMMVKK